MAVGHPYEHCELCSVGVRGAGALCASCREMIARLARIIGEPVARPITRTAPGRPQPDPEAARLFVRALNIDIFNVSQYKPQPDSP